jgi:maleylacetate reductase
MNPFTYDQLAARIVFGAGRVREVGGEVERLGARRVMLIADGQARAPASDITGQLGSRVALSWNEVAQHVPVDLAERARSAATEESIDCVVCVGGGSSTGLAKALALSHAVPIVAVPTTYAGSEQTTIYGLTGGRRKETGKNAIVQPKTVVYDPELTIGLPPGVTGPSAFNALAHSVEALYAPGCNPVTTALALEGVRAIHDSLPTVMA